MSISLRRSVPIQPKTRIIFSQNGCTRLYPGRPRTHRLLQLRQRWSVRSRQYQSINEALGASRSQKQRLALRRSHSQKQRPALRRQNAWGRDQQRRKRPLRRGRKCFSYRLVYNSLAISIPSSRFHSFSFIFIHFHVFWYKSVFIYIFNARPD